MRAWRVNELGHPSTSLRLEHDLPLPEPGPGQVRIRVGASNINFADILLCQGVYQDRPGVPFTPGLETAGIVEAAGDGVDLEPGTLIAAMAALPAGGYAEYALARAPTALTFPDDVPAPSATVLYSTFQTAHVALHRRAGLSEGEWLLVHGASSGVGEAAVQLGVAAGARVIATAGSPAKRDHCANLGARHVLDSRGIDLQSEIMDITAGRGVDVAFDPVGGPVGDLTRRVMAWEGRLVVIGFASGEVTNYPGNHVLVKNYAVLGLHWGAYVEHGGRGVLEEAHAELLSLYRSGAIQPPVSSTIPLEEVPQALAALEDRTVIGRLVLTP
ncbi:MAG: NADPH:quinone oxidoreductase family protein [Acidimicrobiia bacterium]|nr:NADPH:quinone oxidoreductase family protein [Acidimicrobiia bacterium]